MALAVPLGAGRPLVFRPRVCAWSVLRSGKNSRVAVEASCQHSSLPIKSIKRVT